jgi:alkylated DNA repair dioxygenase AlkB
MDLELVDAKVLYINNYITEELQNKIFDKYRKIFNEEERKTVSVDERTYTLNRKTLVLVDEKLKNYIIPKIWGNGVTIMTFDDDIREIKNKLSTDLNYNFNICLCNYYPNGKSNISFHSDNEEKGDIECIASISIGAIREFGFRKKNDDTDDTKEIIKKINLESGSLLVMDSGCQNNYEHSLLTNKEIKEPRLNITFRHFKFEEYSQK